MSSSAPAKIILFGEHAVVYGYPAVAVPFNALSATAESTPAPAGSGLTLRSQELQEEYRLRPDLETFGGPLTFAAQLTLTDLNVPIPDLTIEIRSSIPIGGGFGSGAAVTAALIRELSTAIGKPMTNDEVNKLVFEVERTLHGNPSGIDNTTIVYDRPVCFVRGDQPRPFSLGAPIMLVVGDSGVHGSTRETVADVRRFREANPVAAGPMFDRIGAIVETARSAIEKGDIAKIGPLMTENHGLLRALTVSSEILDRMVTSALKAGALGAKLSGGGRGGNVIALVESDTAVHVAAAFRGAGAVRTWITTLQ